MRMYQIPPDTREKEKIIGGVLDLYQFFWILIGLLIGAGVFALLFFLIGGIFSIVIGAIFCLTGVPFAFYRKNGLTLFQLIKYTYLFNKKNHYLPNMRKEVDF